MNDQPTHPRDKAIVEKEAIAWFTRMNGKPSSRDAQEFEAWLAASVDHQHAFDEVCHLWSDMGSVAEAAGENTDTDVSEPLRKIAELRKQRRPGSAGPIVALCLALLVAGCWFWLERPNLLQDLRADIVTARGERREIGLADGSKILLDADTAIDVNLSSSERRVRLLRGAAFFDVAHTGAPFVVEAGGGEVQVLGTAFDVSMEESREVAVTLARGSVRVSIPANTEAVVLQPGQKIAYGAHGLGEVGAADIDQEMAWHKGRFIFTDQPLANVISQIARYRDGRIIMLGSRMGDIRVSGNIALQDTDQALASMQSSVGFSMHSFGKLTVIGP